MARRVVVTGAAGFIGSHLAEELLEAGAEVVGVDAFSAHYARPLKEANLAGARAHARFTFHELDLAHDALDAAFEGADSVFHLAALPGLAGWDRFDQYVLCNLVATQRVLETSLRHGLRHVIHASTSSVYGLEARCDEEGALAPCSAYGVTKLAAETLARTYERTFGVPLTVLRFFSVYGPRQRPDMAYNIFIRAMLTGAPVRVHGDGEQSRSNTYVSDVVRGARAAWDQPQASLGETFNLGGGQVVTVNRALDLLSEITGAAVERISSPSRPGDQRHTEADFGKATRLLGYTPRTSLRDGLAAQVAWQRG